MSTVSIAQENVDKYMSIALEEYDNDNYGLAMNFLDSARKINPNNAQAYFLEARIYEKEGLKRFAIEAYDNGLILDPNEVDAYVSRAQLRHEVRDHRDFALGDIDAAIKIDNANPVLYERKAYYLASTLNPVTMEPDLQKAIENMDMAISLDHKNDEYYVLRGQYKFTAGERLSALKDLTLAIELAPDNDQHYHDRGLTYLSIDNYKEAETDFTKAISLNPSSESYYLKRGHARYNQTNYNAAIDDFTQSINLLFQKIMQTEGKISLEHPYNTALRDTYIFRGSAFIFVESSYEACEDFKRARELGSGKALNYIRRYCQF